MEALAGLAVFGIACNVMQTIGFSLEACAACKRVWQGRSPAPELDAHRTALQKAAHDLQQSLISPSSQTSGTPQEAELRKTAGEITRLAQKLEKQLNDCKSSAIKYLVVKKHKIDRLSQSLKDLQGIMELRILLSLREKLASQHASLEQRLGGIDQNTANFIQQLASGNTKLDTLVDCTTGKVRTIIEREAEKTRVQAAANTLAIRDLVVEESTDTRSRFETTFNDNRTIEVQTARVDAFLDSLRYPEMNTRRNASAINNNHEGTYQWIFEDYPEPINRNQKKWDDFRDWLQSEEKTYWISGKAGSGKSSLILQLIDDKRTKAYLERWSTDAMVISAFIWNAGSSLQRSQVGVLATLLHQSFSGNKQAAADYLNDHDLLSSKRTISDWSKAELLQTLKSVICSRLPPVCIFIDGLDEIDPKEHNGAYGLLEMLENLASLQNIKMCLGSREEPVFAAKLTTYPRLRLQDLTWNDMSTFVKESFASYLRESSSKPITSRQVQALVNTIIARADGVFLWVRLVMKSIRNGLLFFDDCDNLNRRIGLLPSDLSGLYANMFERLNQDDQQLYQAETALYFNAVFDTFDHNRTLFEAVLISKPSLLRAFLSGSDELTREYVIEQCRAVRHQILAKCVGLIEIFEPENNSENIAQSVITFMHRSVRDFLQDTQEGQRLLVYDVRQPAEREITSLFSAMVDSTCSATYSGSPEDSDMLILQNIFGSLSDHCHSPRSVPIWSIPSLELPLLDLISGFLHRRCPSILVDNAMLEFAAIMGSKEFLTRFMQSFSQCCSPAKQMWMDRILSCAADLPRVSVRSPAFWSDEGMLRYASLLTWSLHEGADPNFLPPAINFSPVLRGIYQTAVVQLLQRLVSVLYDDFRGINETAPHSRNIWMNLVSEFLENGGDVKSRCLQNVALPYTGFNRFGVLAWWPRPEWVRRIGRGTSLLCEMNVCQMFRGVKEKLEGWIESCNLPEPRKRHLRLLLEDNGSEPEKAILIERLIDGQKSYYSPTSEVPGREPTKESWAEILPFSVVRVQPVELLVSIGYLPQEAATHNADEVLYVPEGQFWPSPRVWIFPKQIGHTSQNTTTF
ncbi:hypothetical protein K491DRAFT_668438 [Lophiostoma macrostomum CBS 122681]|uniref:Uncharacterized protein n=1 Tax=Lophiostoma macrostomum CBS 122681 TaxID=1314788 RepID=A0A6A6STG5_9PLEO|nr:hypothetical protein K491DRAFT_668438 [Lophiostoma macrostomum CBS 122681]